MVSLFWVRQMVVSNEPTVCPPRPWGCGCVLMCVTHLHAHTSEAISAKLWLLQCHHFSQLNRGPSRRQKMILPLILHSQNGVTESAVWRLYAGKISNLNPPCKLSPLLGILADRRRHLLHLNVTVSTQHTPSVGPAPRPSLGTACQPKRNFGSFCNNF